MPESQFKNILVPYTGTDEDDRLLQAVCRMAKANKGKVTVVHVVEVPMALPVEAENFPEAEAAEMMLAEWLSGAPAEDKPQVALRYTHVSLVEAGAA